MTFAKPSRLIAMLLGAALLASCDKNAVQEITGPVTGARVKFFNFGINAPGVNFYANDTKVTGISSTTGAESTTGTVYGGVGSSGLYSSLPAGTYAIKSKIAATVDKDLAISTVNTTLAAGKAYSVYLSGFYDATAKSVEGFVVEDVFPDTINFAAATVRFVNASPNSQPMTLFAKNTLTGVEVPVGATVAYKAGGAFITLPPAVYDLSTRTAGSGVNAIARTAVSFVGGRVYTISARGDMTVVSTTATNRPFLDNTTNR